MINYRFKTSKLTDEDKKYFKEACRFGVKQLKLYRNKNYKITIRVIEKKEIKDTDKKKLLAFTDDMGIIDGIRNIDVVIYDQYVNKYTNPRSKLSKIIKCLFHELTHAKQMVKNQLHFYSDNTYKFNGKIHKSNHDNPSKAYFSSPFEVEAFGMEVCLYSLFLIHQKELDKNKRSNCV